LAPDHGGPFRAHSPFRRSFLEGIFERAASDVERDLLEIEIPNERPSLAN